MSTDCQAVTSNNPNHRQTRKRSPTWRAFRGDLSVQNGKHMSKSRYRPEHMRMLNDKRWLETKRVVWDRAQGLCEWCKRDGYIVAGVDCHHIIPFESAKTQAEMERLCYDADHNVVLLCVACHQRAHKELMSKTKAKVKERRAQAFERWKDKMKGE